MDKHWYALKIKPKYLRAWENDLKEEFNIFVTKDGDEIVLIELALAQAIKMKFCIISSNCSDHYGLKLVKLW